MTKWQKIATSVHTDWNGVQTANCTFPALVVLLCSLENNQRGWVHLQFSSLHAPQIKMCLLQAPVGTRKSRLSKDCFKITLLIPVDSCDVIGFCLMKKFNNSITMKLRAQFMTSVRKCTRLSYFFESKVRP